MKKLATWIYKTSQQLRPKSHLEERSQDRLPDANTSHIEESSASNKVWTTIKASVTKIASRQGQQTDSQVGNIDKFKQKYIHLPQPYSRFLKPLVITLSLICAYALFGFYLLPAVLKAKIPSIIQEETGRKASLANIKFNPFQLIASIDGFNIEEKNGKPFIAFDQINIDISGVQSIKNLALVIDDINLDKPLVHLIKQKDGKFNFEDMLKSNNKEEPEKPNDGKLFPLTITKLAIKNGKLSWEDRHFATSVSEEVAPINLTVSELSTEVNAKGKLDFNLALKSGGKLALKSTVGVNPLAAEGGIKLDKLKLQKVLALALSDSATFDLEGLSLLNFDYKLGYEKDALKAIIKKSRFEIQDVQFTDKSATKALLNTPTFAIETDGIISMVKNTLDIALSKTKLISRDLQFSQHMPEPMSVVIPILNHELDIKLSQGKDGLFITSNKSKLTLRDFKFSGLNEPISVSIPEFSHETDITFSQNKDGLKISANAANIALTNFQFTGLHEGKVEAKIPKLNVETAFQLNFSDNNSDINLSKGKAKFHDLQVSEKDENTVLIKIPGFGFNDLSIDLKKKELNVASINSNDAEFRAWLNSDGTLNYQKLIPTSEGKKVDVTQTNYATASTVDFKEDVTTVNTVATAATEPVKEWLLHIATLELKNYMVTFEDRTLKKGIPMTAKPINLRVENITNKIAAKLPFQLDVGVNKAGLIKLKGDTVISPLSAKIDLDIKEIGLKELQPYVEKYARLYLLDGKFSTAGKLTLKQVPKKPLDVKFKGNAGIANLLTRDKLQNKDLIRWKNLTFQNLDIDLLANRYSAATLLIEKPYAKVTIRKDKTINFSDLMIVDKDVSAKSAKSAKPVKSVHVTQSNAVKSTKPFFKLDQVRVVEGSSDFADLSLILPFAAQIESLDGGAKGISSDQNSTIKVDLKGSAYDIAPVDIAGEISPYAGNYDISLKFDGLPMPLVTPYMVQFAGYRIEKGKMTLGLQYKVEKGMLNAANNILIDQLELGEKVDNPDAVSLPLELAIALLKDSDGKIKLDVPLTGSLEDPKFNVGGLIMDALVNVLTKIVTSPFNAIASLIGSEENLSVVGFMPGKPAMDAKELKKLDDVAKALKEKPILNLEIKGAAFEEQDWPILREDALLEQLKVAKAEELSKEEDRKVGLEQFKLSEDDYNDLLADAFIRRFPTMAEKSLFGKPKLISPLTGDFYQVAKQKMSEIIKPDPKRLKDLASNRSQAIAKYLVQKAGVPSARIFILDSVVDPERESKEIVSALSLKTN